jgi:hypothetical protein
LSVAFGKVRVTRLLCSAPPGIHNAAWQNLSSRSACSMR